MKTAVSIPEDVFKAAENLAQEKGWSRSRLYAEAVSQFVRCHRAEDITKNLNALYAHEDSHMEKIWDSLCHEEGEVEPPSWHKDILEERRRKLENGEAEFISIEALKARRK